MTKIYTKTGDKGKTSLFDGTRVDKNNLRLETYGTLDELNAYLGVANSFLKRQQKIVLLIQEIQKDLLDIGAYLANPKNPPSKKITSYLDERVTFFEKTIDEMTSELKPLRNFIIFTGDTPGAFMQLARAVSRRGERRLVALSQKEPIDGSFLRYFNRVSDLLYTISRFITKNEKGKEIIWIPRG